MKEVIKKYYKETLKNFIEGFCKFLVYTYILMILWNVLAPKFFNLVEMVYKEALMFHVFINLINRDRTPKKRKE